jgi:hypothetical protein
MKGEENWDAQQKKREKKRANKAEAGSCGPRYGLLDQKCLYNPSEVKKLLN